MQLDERKMALATRCLWSLQESELDIEGLLLTHIDGLTVTSTLQGNDSIQRLAATTTTMFLLSEQASEAWGSGESMELLITLQPDDAAEAPRHVYMKPVGYAGVLVGICKAGKSLTSIIEKLERATHYLDMVISGSIPPMPDWQA